MRQSSTEEKELFTGKQISMGLVDPVSAAVWTPILTGICNTWSHGTFNSDNHLPIICLS